MGRAWRLPEDLQFGIVGINEVAVTHVRAINCTHAPAITQCAATGRRCMQLTRPPAPFIDQYCTVRASPLNRSRRPLVV